MTRKDNFLVLLEIFRWKLQYLSNDNILYLRRRGKSTARYFVRLLTNLDYFLE